jgi:regulator of sigma D
MIIKDIYISATHFKCQPFILDKDNKTANGELCDTEQRMYQILHYFQSVLWFHATSANVISFYAQKKCMTFSAPFFM